MIDRGSVFHGCKEYTRADWGASPPVLSPLLLLVRLTLYPTRQPVQRLPYTSYLNWMSTPFLPWRWSDFSHAPDRGFHLFASRIKRVCWVSSLFLCIILFVNTYFKFYVIFLIFLRWNEEALGVIQAPSVMISLTRPFTLVPGFSLTHPPGGRVEEDPRNKVAHS